MLQLIRDKTQGLITWIIIIFICVTFALWGISNYFISGNEKDKIARVGNKVITSAHLKNAYHQLLQQEQILGQDLSDVDQQKLRLAALNELIATNILVSAAEKEGFLITDKEIYDILFQIPELQHDGQFNPDRLQSMLASYGLTQQQFFSSLRQKLLITQVREGLFETSFITSNEMKLLSQLYAQKREFSFALISKDMFSNATISSQITEKQIADYYQAHLNDYQAPTQIRLHYIELSPDSKDFITKSDQLANISYEFPKSLNEAASALNLAIKSSPLITMEGSKDSPVTRSGEVLKAAFSHDLLYEKYNSDVISLDNGTLVVVRVAEHIPQQPKPLKEVKSQVINILKNQAASKQAFLAGQALSTELTKNKSLVDLARKYGYQYHSNQIVSRNSDTVNQQILTVLFALPSHLLPQQKVIQLANGNVAVIEMTKVLSNEHNQLSTEEYSHYSQQITEDFGKIDYELYRNAVAEHTEIKTYLQNSEE